MLLRGPERDVGVVVLSLPAPLKTADQPDSGAGAE